MAPPATINNNNSNKVSRSSLLYYIKRQNLDFDESRMDILLSFPIRSAIRVKPQPPVITPNACVYNYMPPQPSHYNQFPYYGYYGPYGPYGPDYSMVTN